MTINYSHYTEPHIDVLSYLANNKHLINKRIRFRTLINRKIDY